MAEADRHQGGSSDSPDAERMVDGIEKELKSSAETTFWEMARTGRDQNFLYSTLFGEELLLWDSSITADELGTAREILERLWSSDYDMLVLRSLS